MKRSWIAVCLGLLLCCITGCDLFGPVKTLLAPPAWIRGTWKDISGTVSFVFSSDDVVMTSPTSSIDYKAADVSSDANNDVYDATDGTTYSILLKSGGELYQTVKFEQIDPTTVGWTVTTQGTSVGPIRLYKQ